MKAPNKGLIQFFKMSVNIVNIVRGAYWLGGRQAAGAYGVTRITLFTFTLQCARRRRTAKAFTGGCLCRESLVLVT